MYAGLVDILVAKTRTWEEEHGLTFAYDGVPLLAMLDEYALLRHDREEEKKRMRVSLGISPIYFNSIHKLTLICKKCNRIKRNSMSS